jgi:hypothetical protein
VRVQLEERAPAADHERVAQGAVPERDLVVAVEDAERELVIRGQRQHPERLDAALAVQTLLAEEARQHVRPVHLGQIVLVHGVQRAEAGAHEPEPRRRAEGQAQQRDVGLVEPHGEVA